MSILVLAFYVGLKGCGLCLAVLSCAKSEGKVLRMCGFPHFLLQKVFPNAAIRKAAPAPVKPVRPVIKTSLYLSRQSLSKLGLELGLRISQKGANPSDCGFHIIRMVQGVPRSHFLPNCQFHFVVQRNVAESQKNWVK